jgi:two-component system cell cycle sensor histidine kinase/response regulator CckA
MAQDYDEPIDLLISDAIMPVLGGGELADRLKSWHPETRVLFISGYADEQLSRQGVVSSGMSFLAKPFSFDDLAAKVRDTLDSEPSGKS